MKIISWNVNGLRAAANKGFYEVFKEIDADAFCIQETKMQEEQIDNKMKNLGNFQFWNSAEKKGYSGTAVFLKEKPIKVTKDIAKEYLKEILETKKKIHMEEKSILDENHEGRLITCEYEKFFLVNCYVPNSKRELERLKYREEWEEELRIYLNLLDKIKPVIYCGDLNVAHKEIDLKNPATNHHSAGFTDEERNKMTELLNSGFIDGFRYLYPNKENEYTWWSYMFHAREKNVGWRIDYFILSERLADKIKDVKIHQEIMGSDHCPIELEIDL